MKKYRLRALVTFAIFAILIVSYGSYGRDRVELDATTLNNLIKVFLINIDVNTFDSVHVQVESGPSPFRKVFQSYAEREQNRLQSSTFYTTSLNVQQQLLEREVNRQTDFQVYLYVEHLMLSSDGYAVLFLNARKEPESMKKYAVTYLKEDDVWTINQVRIIGME